MTVASTPALPTAVTVSAPGKIILAGEHAAVYGRPALVAAVDLRLTVQARSLPAGAGATAPNETTRDDRRASAAPGIVLDLSDLGVLEAVTADALRDYTARARERWQEYAADATPARFRALRGDDAAHLAKIALGETLLAHGEGTQPRWRFRIESRIPVGSGMGSSAAAAAALVIAALRLLGRPATLDAVEPLVLEAERRQHGTPSGVDGAVVLRGGVQWVERSAAGRLQFAALPAGLALLDDLRVVDTGTPAQSTGEVVAAVRQLRGADPAAFDRLLDRLELATRRLRDALVAGDGGALLAAIRDAQRGLEEAGVVPEPVRALVRRIEALGGAAKVSGAGALLGPEAGCLVVYHPRVATLELGGLVPPDSLLAVRLGAEGAREEREAT